MTGSNAHQRSPMLRELNGRRVSLRWQIESQRWSTWARSLSERHSRLTERRDALDLVLARLPLAKLLRERWLLSSQRYYPRIDLAIHPILRQSIWQGQTQLLPGSRTMVTRFAESHSSIGRQFLNYLIFLRRSGIRDGKSRPTFNDTSDSTTQKQSSLLRSPLKFQRLFHTGESLRFHNNEILRLERAQITTESSNRTLLDRIARLSQRLEERVSETTTLVTQRVPAFEVAPAVAPSYQTFSREVEGARQQNTIAAGAIDIAQVTDQVIRQLDRKIVATRERLGRI